MRANHKYLQILLLIACLVLSQEVFSQSSAREIKTLIGSNLKAIGLSTQDADDCVVNSNHKDPVTGIEYVYVQQTYKTIRVFNIVITLAFKNDKLLYSSGKFLNTETSFPPVSSPAVEAVRAVSNAVGHLKLKPRAAFVTTKNNFRIDRKIMFAADDIAKREIESELLWAQDDSGKVHLTWNVSIDVKNSNDFWNVRIDAITGELVNKNNWTVYEKNVELAEYDASNIISHPEQSNRKPGYSGLKLISGKPASTWPTFFSPPNVQNASYRVIPYPFESLNYGTVDLDNNPWIKAGVNNSATTYGWHFDGAVNYLTTRGNNVFAYDDSTGFNSGRSVSSTTQAPFVNFDITPNFSIQPYDSTNRNFGIVNLFYWNNIIHDVFYQYGFTESAGNFQADNLGRGGSGNDFVRAEAQDGSGINNANFNTPPDGLNGRMQMFLFSGTPNVVVSSPASIASPYTATESSVSLNNRLYKKGAVSSQVVFYDDASSGGNTHEACDSSVAPINSINGKIVYISRGTCPFTTKMRAAQKYGAAGVLIVNNVPGPPISFGTVDNLITIPGVMISYEDGAKVAAEIPNNVMMMLSTGLLYDGGIDNGIVTHEYGHGISTRLTGGRTNSSCLLNAEQGGEGWSDYLSLMLTTDWKNTALTDGSKLRPVGTYALNQPVTGRGIRRVPYTTDMSIDTVTYSSIDDGEEHRIGEVWCSALWDMTWNIIRHEGSITGDLYNSSANGGNIIALKLVMEGMKLQPCRPGFLDARNAILAADSILFNNSHKCDIWNAFARRGMGYSAMQGSSGSTTDQVPAFDVPSGIVVTKAAAPLIINAGAEISYNTTVTCECKVPTGSFIVSDTIAPGFAFVRSNTGLLNGNIVQYPPLAFSNSLESVNLTLTIKANSAGCSITKPVNDDREANQIGGLSSARISGGTNWVISTAHAFSGSSSWHAADNGSSSNLTLTTGEFIPGNLSVLSFWHYFVNEIYLDGGKVEISSNNGSTWTDAGPFFLKNGYNNRLGSGAPQENTYAFTGTSSSNNTQFIQSMIDLSAFKDQPLRVRFRYETNDRNAGNQLYEGWYIDDITVTNGCGGISKLSVTNSVNGTVDSVYRPFFILANSVLPLRAINFDARQTGREVVLNWQTSAERNTKNFEVERSSNGLQWTRIGEVASKNMDQNSYLFSDKSPMNQQNYYRIRINDRDGSYSYTNIKKIEFSKIDMLTLVPNPAFDKTTVYFGVNSKAGVLMVTDLKGRLIQQHSIEENTGSYIIPTRNLLPGSYMIRMQSKSGVTTRKLVVAH